MHPYFWTFLDVSKRTDDLVCHLPLFISDQCMTYTSRVDIKRAAPSWFELWGKPTGSSSYHRTRCPRSAMTYGKEKSEEQAKVKGHKQTNHSCSRLNGCVAGLHFEARCWSDDLGKSQAYLRHKSCVSLLWSELVFLFQISRCQRFQTIVLLDIVSHIDILYIHLLLSTFIMLLRLQAGEPTLVCCWV